MTGQTAAEQAPPVSSGEEGVRPVAQAVSEGWIESVLGLSPSTQIKIGLSVAAVLLVWLLRRLLVRYVDRRVDDARHRYQWSKGSAYGAFVLAVLLISQIWLETLRSLGTFLGLVGAGLAIALRDPVVNLAGWIFILWRRPFELGDRIEVGGNVGDVVDVRIFQFTILEVGGGLRGAQSTGRVIHVPNARLFSEPLANYTMEFAYVWNELPVLVTFESDWEQAKKILLEIVGEVAGEIVDEARSAVRRASRKYLIHYRTLTPIVYTSVEESGVLLTARYLTGVRQRRGIAEAIWERLLRALADEPEIDLAYPTRRVFYNPVEGKEEVRADAPPPREGSAAPESRRSGFPGAGRGGPSGRVSPPPSG